jgi:hypothetical protein
VGKLELFLGYLAGFRKENLASLTQRHRMTAVHKLILFIAVSLRSVCHFCAPLLFAECTAACADLTKRRIQP